MQYSIACLILLLFPCIFVTEGLWVVCWSIGYARDWNFPESTSFYVKRPCLTGNFGHWVHVLFFVTHVLKKMSKLTMLKLVNDLAFIRNLFV